MADIIKWEGCLYERYPVAIGGERDSCRGCYFSHTHKSCPHTNSGDLPDCIVEGKGTDSVIYYCYREPDPLYLAFLKVKNTIK